MLINPCDAFKIANAGKMPITIDSGKPRNIGRRRKFTQVIINTLKKIAPLDLMKKFFRSSENNIIVVVCKLSKSS